MNGFNCQGKWNELGEYSGCNQYIEREPFRLSKIGWGLSLRISKVERPALIWSKFQ